MPGVKPRVILFRPAASVNYRQGEMPVQLLAIARMLLDDYDLTLVNTEVGLSRKSRSQVEAEIAEALEGCLIFGVTAMTGHGLEEALAMSAFVRERSPETKIVWGGWHPSLLPEQTLSEPDIDFVVVGQGEETIVELARALVASTLDFAGIQGLGWKENGRPVLNPKRPLHDMNAMPPLPFHLLDDAFFEQVAGMRTAATITSVGCPLDCGFCADRAVYGGKWNRLSAERALADMKTLRDDFGVTAVRILDSNFFVHWPRGIAILQGLHDMGMRAIWVNARIPTLLKAKAEHLALFRETVDYFLVGAESGSDMTLEMINKMQSVEDIRRVARLYGENGIPICFSTLVGVPYEDPQEWKREFRLTLSLLDEVLGWGGELHTAQVHLYTPYPGTPMYTDAVARGFEAPEDLIGWSDVELFTPKLPYLPPNLGERVEFITTYILQLRRSGYHFYRGGNPVAGAFFAVAERILKAIFYLRWKMKYFDFPLEKRFIEAVITRGRTEETEAP